MPSEPGLRGRTALLEQVARSLVKFIARYSTNLLYLSNFKRYTELRAVNKVAELLSALSSEAKGP